MTRYDEVKNDLVANPKIWLVTGVAGFIGSNLLEALLKLNQTVVGLDNFATGFQHNLDEVQSLVSLEQWQRFEFVKGDICSLSDCQRVMSHSSAGRVNYVLHQAALGSVPRSINDPITTNAANVTGFLNILVAARDAEVDSFTYAASSSTYGDHPALPKVEENIGKPLSPYAVTKYVNELYADVFAKTYHFNSIGLRYFNVFGPRQNPKGAYAAVIPCWIATMINGDDVAIHGNGETSRDFTFIENAVQLNILAATNTAREKCGIYNMAVGEQTSLNELFNMIKDTLNKHGCLYLKEASYTSFRLGDVLHSKANIDKAKIRLDYSPSYPISRGLERTLSWYLKNRI